MSEIDADHMRAWRLFLTAQARVIPRLGAELEAERNLPLSWYEVLLRLNEAPGRKLRLQELARSVILSQSRITRLVDAMVAAGLIRRERSSDDRRGSYAVLTDRGRRTLRAAAPTHLRGIEEHFTRHLTEEEARAMSSALTKILGGLGEPGSAAGQSSPARRSTSWSSPPPPSVTRSSTTPAPRA